MTSTTTGAPTIAVGLTKTVLAHRLYTHPANWDMTPAERRAWFKRTDFAWVCNARECAYRAGVLYTAPEGARRGARAHSAEHHHGRAVIRDAP